MELPRCAATQKTLIFRPFKPRIVIYYLNAHHQEIWNFKKQFNLKNKKNFYVYFLKRMKKLGRDPAFIIYGSDYCACEASVFFLSCARARERDSVSEPTNTPLAIFSVARAGLSVCVCWKRHPLSRESPVSAKANSPQNSLCWHLFFYLLALLSYPFNSPSSSF